ncbi:chymotrypsin-2-like [Agrilus planipennis]|uniref:Chymotrypsin-2-like n=1 Tax=Agrilus planipennis TaxID=224129 RepID=A0A7F5QXP2_AGRPL|nr:chymotrypsin-2-like [Agrilus planipennis]
MKIFYYIFLTVFGASVAEKCNNRINSNGDYSSRLSPGVFTETEHLYKYKPHSHELHNHYANDKDYSGEMHLPPRRKIDNFVSDDVDADEPTNRIVGGEKVNNIEEYPFHVVMIGENDEHYRVCGGAIIADKFIITCAHCFVSIDAVDHHVKAGISNLLQKAQIREGAKVFKHKKYPGGYFENDIGLLKVKEPFKFSAKVGKIGLPHAAACFIVGDIVTILGFGQTTVHPTEIPNENLHVLKAPLTSRERCMERKIEFVGVEMTERVLCTDTPPGYGVCFGDSGGPMVIDGYVIGLVAHGSMCALGEPDIYTSVTFYLKWIHNILTNYQ